MPIVAAAAAIFKIWMLIDAVQRCGGRTCSNYWLFIILMPFGDLAYFFMVKLQDPQFVRLKNSLFSKPVTLEELRYRVQESPSTQNRMHLAQALVADGEFTEAAQHIEEVLRSDPGNREALYGQAQCLLNLGELRKAIPVLEGLCERDTNYEECQAALDLARAYWESGQREKAIEFLQRLSKSSSRLRLSNQLAEYLAETGAKGESRRILERSLQEYRHAPTFLKRRERSFAKQATALLKRV